MLCTEHGILNFSQLLEWNNDARNDYVKKKENYDIVLKTQSVYFHVIIPFALAEIKPLLSVYMCKLVVFFLWPKP